MEKILIAKVNCRKDFRETLLATCEPIEARSDLWWRSDMPYHLTTTTKQAFHTGKSWLGEILMKIRSQFRTKNDLKHQEHTRPKENVQ